MTVDVQGMTSGLPLMRWPALARSLALFCGWAVCIEFRLRGCCGCWASIT